MKKILDIIKSQAMKAFKKDEIPVGSVIVIDGKIIAKAYNTREKSGNVLKHAEIIVIHKAAKKLGTWKLSNAILYTTLAPCEMCRAVIKQSRIKEVVYLAKNNKEVNYKTIFSNIEDSESSEILKKYFKNKRL